MYTSKTSRTNQQGFTLIELSIVLVIIGLIVGGVLVGQDMIKAAEIRATVGQVEKYNAASNTFRTKYNGLPGDLASPTNFGFTATDANNKGNGLVESCTAGNGLLFGCENKAYWNQLSGANLIDGSFTDTTALAAFAAVASFTGITPGAKMGKGNSFFIGANGALNEFRLAGLTQAAAGGGVTSTNALTPLDAYAIDTKLDDGTPTAGIVLGYDGAALARTLTAAGAAVCQNPANSYNISAAALTQLCNLGIRTSF
jgi:prepilin-type N-terminal cleavage/methylation domain-containing protein